MSGPPPVNPNDAPFLISTSLDLKNSEFNRTAIIDKVFLILTKIIETLQKTAATQSDRLKLYTEWQKAYGAQMNQIKAFTANNPALSTVITGSTDPQRNARDDLNKTNTTWTEQVRGRRGIVQDDAKALQTNVNQSSDSVNQQTNMATSLLEQLSTLLGAIYR